MSPSIAEPKLLIINPRGGKEQRLPEFIHLTKHIEVLPVHHRPQIIQLELHRDALVGHLLAVCSSGHRRQKVDNRSQEATVDCSEPIAHLGGRFELVDDLGLRVVDQSVVSGADFRLDVDYHFVEGGLVHQFAVKGEELLVELLE